MAEARFPKTKYLRQLHAMRREMEDWSRQYAAASQTSDSEWLMERFAQRAEQTARLVQLLQQVIDRLYTTPRLS